MDFNIGPGHQHAGQRVRDRRSTPRKAISGCVVANSDIDTPVLGQLPGGRSPDRNQEMGHNHTFQLEANS
jgi:hypothetical protein